MDACAAAVLCFDVFSFSFSAMSAMSAGWQLGALDMPAIAVRCKV
jgi:hypothetical protein